MSALQKIAAITGLVFILSQNAFAENSKAVMYRLDSGRKEAVYSVEYTETVKDGSAKYNAVYKTPGGEIVGTDETILENGKIVLYSIVRNNINEKGLLEVKADELSFSYTKEGKTKSDKEKIDPRLVVTSTLRSYVQSHWAELMKGDKVEIRLGVLERLETVGFEFFRLKEFNKDGKNLVEIVMKPSSFLIAALVKPIHFIFEKDSKRMIEAKGRTVLKVKDGDKWSDFDAETVYSY